MTQKMPAIYQGWDADLEFLPHLDDIEGEGFHNPQLVLFHNPQGTMEFKALMLSVRCATE